MSSKDFKIPEGLWGILKGTEVPSDPETEYERYVSRKDKVLTTIVLAVDTTPL